MTPPDPVTVLGAGPSARRSPAHRGRRLAFRLLTDTPNPSTASSP